MHRHCIEKLNRWFEKVDSGPLVIRGARQVGKTTLVRMLAEKKGLQLIEVNMETRPSFVPMLSDKSQAKIILESLLVQYGVSADASKVLFFFDEAQESPGLFAYLRYFKELAPQYKVAAAGSLFEFELTKGQYAQGPTGRVEYVHVEPMTFSEFLLARNPQAYTKYQELELSGPVPDMLHSMFLGYFKEYLICGGMPKAVKSWVEEQSPLNIDEIKSDLAEGYLNDLPKYTQLNDQNYDANLLKLLFTKISASPANTQKYSELAPGVRAEKVRSHLDVLCTARVLRKSVHSSQNKPPLVLGENAKRYKFFALDVGLTYSLLELPVAEIYVADDINSVANGIIAEQFVAQTLAALPPHHKRSALYHWERAAKSATAEVDFLLSLNGKIIPIECKAGNSKKMRSMHQLLREKEFSNALRLYSGNVECESLVNEFAGKVVETRFLSIPHYLLERYVAIETGTPLIQKY